MKRDAGCRLHVRIFNKDKPNGQAPDGAYHFYDVGPQQLAELVARFTSVEIIEWGKYESEDYKAERSKIEACLTPRQ